MKHIPEQIAHLLFLRLNESLSAEQQEALDSWLSESPYNEVILRRAGKDEIFGELGKLKTINTEHAWENMLKVIATQDAPQIEKKSVNINMARLVGWSAAAALILCMSYLMYQKFNPETDAETTKGLLAMDVGPGVQGAILTFADGRQVSLDSLKNGEVNLQNGQKAKLVNGSLTYEQGAGSPVYNTVFTPKRRQYQLTLPDGTMVWLNSASSIRFPTRFTDAERKVEVTGEAYFEVAKNKHQPFRIVTKEKVEVLVLGTHFNVNSYENEDKISTTLLEGAVRVFYNNKTVVIKPGQQAQVLPPGKARISGIQTIDHVDLDKTIAWKNGTFNFEGTDFREVMRQLERWYDIEVVYERTAPKVKFFGEISRNENLSDVLKALEESHVHFRLEEERRLIVLEN